MNWIATKRTFILLFSIVAVYAFATPAKAKQAKCLLEIGEAHYIGSLCEFTPLDKRGSFRIADSRLGIEAEVKVTAPHEGIRKQTVLLSEREPAMARI